MQRGEIMMKKRLLPFIFAISMVLCGCTNSATQEEIDLVEALYADEVWLTDENRHNITDEFKEEYYDDYQNKKYHEIYEEMMKYDPTSIKDLDGNNIKINK